MEREVRGGREEREGGVSIDRRKRMERKGLLQKLYTWHTHRELEEDEGTNWMLDERFGSRRSSCATTGRMYNIE